MESKEGKKAAKAEQKQAKKDAKESTKRKKKEESTLAVGATPPSVEPKNIALSPAERSAAAAEKQVRLQRYRVIIGIISAVAAIGTLIIALKPWRWFEW